jgi:hypothetical protein
MRLLAAVLCTALLCSCGKAPEQPKTAEQAKSERDEATRRTRENPVYGDQLKTLDKAKAVQETVNQQAETLRKKVDE